MIWHEVEQHKKNIERIFNTQKYNGKMVNQFQVDFARNAKYCMLPMLEFQRNFCRHTLTIRPLPPRISNHPCYNFLFLSRYTLYGQR